MGQHFSYLGAKKIGAQKFESILLCMPCHNWVGICSMPQSRVQHALFSAPIFCEHVLQVHPQRFGAETDAHDRLAKHLPMNLIQDQWLSSPVAVPARNAVSTSNVCSWDFKSWSQKMAQAKSNPTLKNLVRRFCRSRRPPRHVCAFTKAVAPRRA